MDRITLNRRHIILISSYLFLTVVFFSLGLFVGFRNGNEPILKEVSYNANNVPNTTISPVTTQLPSYYRVILEDGELRLYIDENGISRLISQEKISTDSYPVSDIALLKNGMVFDNADEAVSLMENFIS